MAVFNRETTRFYSLAGRRQWTAGALYPTVHLETNEMRMIATLAATMTVTLLVSGIHAAPPEGPGGKGDRRAASGFQRGPGQAAGRFAGRDSRGGDPTQMISRMLQEFDQDGDQKLDIRELTALMTAMRDRRMGGQAGQRGQGGPGMRPGSGGPGGASQRGRRGSQSDPNETAGGQRPRRPTAE